MPPPAKPFAFKTLAVIPYPGAQFLFHNVEIQFAGPAMILWREQECVAQFASWQGWYEVLDEPVPAKQSGEPATVTQLRPVKVEAAHEKAAPQPGDLDFPDPAA